MFTLRRYYLTVFDRQHTHTRVCSRFNLCSSIPFSFALRCCLLLAWKYLFQKRKRNKICIIGIDTVYLCKAKASKTFVHCQLFKTTSCLLSFLFFVFVSSILFRFKMRIIIIIFSVYFIWLSPCLKLAQQECKCNP